MGLKKLATLLLNLRFISIAFALTWWAAFYSPIHHNQIHKAAQICLYSTNNLCMLEAAVLMMNGKYEILYDPIVFWIGLGLVLKYSLKTED